MAPTPLGRREKQPHQPATTPRSGHPTTHTAGNYADPSPAGQLFFPSRLITNPRPHPRSPAQSPLPSRTPSSAHITAQHVVSPSPLGRHRARHQRDQDPDGAEPRRRRLPPGHGRAPPSGGRRPRGAGEQVADDPRQHGHRVPGPHAPRPREARGLESRHHLQG